MAPFKFFLDPRYCLMEKIHYLRRGTRYWVAVRMPIFRESLSIINKKEKIWLSEGFKPESFGSGLTGPFF